MPYLEQSIKTALINADIEPSTAGHLNYIFTFFAKEYIDRHGESYQRYNDIIGALEGCKLEIYRRLIAEYEDEKIKLNGDVYGGNK